MGQNRFGLTRVSFSLAWCDDLFFCLSVIITKRVIKKVGGHLVIPDRIICLKAVIGIPKTSQWGIPGFSSPKYHLAYTHTNAHTYAHILTHTETHCFHDILVLFRKSKRDRYTVYIIGMMIINRMSAEFRERE